MDGIILLPPCLLFASMYNTNQFYHQEDNQVPPTPKKRDPQKVLKGAYLRSLPYDIWNGDLL